MSEQNVYEQLGVTKDASFEEIQEAKRRLSQQHKGDRKILESIESAYDAIIMDRLKMRQEGKIKVPEGIRFPERNLETPPSLTNAPDPKSPSWVQQLLDTPSREDILWPGGVFSILIVLTVVSQEPSILPLLIAFGLGASVYFLNRKEHRLGRSMILTLIALAVGLGLGSALGNSLDLQNGILNWAGQNFTQLDFSAVVTFVIFWLVSAFLR